jgi:hypothetical protein
VAAALAPIARRFELALRLSPLLRTIGASWSGKILGNAGRLPVLSWAVRNRARMWAWPFFRI